MKSKKFSLVINKPIDNFNKKITVDSDKSISIRSFLKLPISFPKTTGCKKPCTGGVLVKNF